MSSVFAGVEISIFFQDYFSFFSSWKVFACARISSPSPVCVLCALLLLENASVCHTAVILVLSVCHYCKLVHCPHTDWTCINTTNSDIHHAGVGPLAEQITRRRTAAFDHIARLTDNVPARLVLHCQIDTSLGRLPSNTWNRRPGRPRNRWLPVDLV